jgi:cytochrome c biogenesis protein ResB
VVQELPIAITLKQFIMETYDDGSPKRFASDIIIYTKNGDSRQATVDVNKPVEVNGWKIYQYGYDTAMGAESQFSILELVRDPWLPFVYAGIYMMLFGALTMFIFGVRRKKQ